MSLMRLINHTRDAADSESLIYKHGSQWIGDFRKSSFCKTTNASTAYWVTPQGVRSNNWRSNHERRTEYIRHVKVNVTDQTYAPRYSRRTSKILRCEFEFKEVTNNCVLVKRTNQIWNVPATSHRYQRVEDSQVRSIMQNDPNITEEQVYAMLVTPNMMPPFPPPEERNNNYSNHLSLGLEHQTTTTHRENKKSTKTTGSSYVEEIHSHEESGLSMDGFVIIKELRGVAARLWSNQVVTEQEVTDILRPNETSNYTLPERTPRKKIKWLETSEQFIIGKLIFGKTNLDPKLSSGETLFDIYRDEGINIVVSIPEKCVINFPSNGRHISREIDAGVYSVRISETPKVSSIFGIRKAILNSLSDYRVELDFDRYDFLTVIDIDNSVLTDDEGSLGRIGSIEKINGNSDSVDESLLDRIG